MAVPRNIVILQDHLGLSGRVRAMRDAHPEVLAVAPADKDLPRLLPVAPPLNWMSAGDDPIDLKCWKKADAMGLAAIVQHAPEAEFYWFIESDVVATQAVWKALFSEFETVKDDCLATRIFYYGDDPKMERYWPFAPAGATKHFVMAVYRLSAEAVWKSIGEAESLRECFSEIAVPWVMDKHGLSIRRINGRSNYFNSATFRAKGNRIGPDPEKLNHPFKLNTYAP